MTNTRIRFTEDPERFFSSVRVRHASWKAVAKNLGISVRTITAWRARENAMPFDIASAWATTFDIPLPPHEVVDMDAWRRAVGILGGHARQRLYGDIGTPEGRRLGGLRSIQTHKKNGTSPFVARHVFEPVRDAYFAELIGAILGDGAVTTYQLFLYSNFFDEKEYAEFLHDLIERVFRIEAAVHTDESHGVIRVICSRAEVVRHLQEAGLGRGSKVRRQAGVPAWIRSNPMFSQACLRGLIDTDGCVYLDRHIIRGRVYASRCIAFTNASIPLLDFVQEIWESLGFHPTRYGRHVRLRRREEVEKYVADIGFSNPKHKARFGV